MHDVPCCIEYLTLIAGRKRTTALVNALSEAGGRLIRIVYGKGSVKSSYLRDMLGLVPEENKVVITCLMPREKALAALEMLVAKFDFNKPNTGIAFTIPVEKISL